MRKKKKRKRKRERREKREKKTRKKRIDEDEEHGIREHELYLSWHASHSVGW